MCRAPLSCGPSFVENLSRQITSQWQLLCGLESGRKSTTEETYSTKTLNSNRKSRKNGKSRAFRLRLEAIVSRYRRSWTNSLNGIANFLKSVAYLTYWKFQALLHIFPFFAKISDSSWIFNFDNNLCTFYSLVHFIIAGNTEAPFYEFCS